MTNEDWVERQMAAAERAFNRGDIDDKEYDRVMEDIMHEANKREAST